MKLDKILFSNLGVGNVGSIIAFLILNTAIQAQNTAVEKPVLPNFRFFTAKDSVLKTNQNLAADKPILFFYFSTKCEYCYGMVKELTNSGTAFKDVNVVLVSGHKRVNILKFTEGLPPQYFLLKDDEKQMHNYFDYTAVPMLRLYDKNGKLLHRQEGKMAVKDILAILNAPQK